MEFLFTFTLLGSSRWGFGELVKRESEAKERRKAKFEIRKSFLYTLARKELSHDDEF